MGWYTSSKLRDKPCNRGVPDGIRLLKWPVCKPVTAHTRKNEGGVAA